MKRQEVFRTSDLYMAAAISILLQTAPDFQFENGRILFAFPLTDDLFRAMNSYSNGVPLNAFEFAQQIKDLRGQMMERRRAAETKARSECLGVKQ